MNQKSQSKFGTTKGYENPSVKMIESTGIYHTAQGDNQAIKKVNDSTSIKRVIQPYAEIFTHVISQRCDRISFIQSNLDYRDLDQMQEIESNINNRKDEGL